MPNYKKQKGISIVFIILITSFIFTVALGINSISYQQAKTMNEMGLSTVAFFAADSGAERQLYNLYKEEADVKNSFNLTIDPSFPANASTSVLCSSDDPVNCLGGVIQYDDSCNANNFCVNSVGEYKGIKRAVELNY